MTKIIIIDNGQAIVEADVCRLSPVGVECEIPVGMLGELIDKKGRYRTFQFALCFSGCAEEADVDVIGDATVLTVRRISQNNGVLSLRFLKLDSDSKKLISSFLSTGKVVSLKKAMQKLRA